MTSADARFDLGGPFDLARTLRSLALWGASPWMKVEPDQAWFARRTEAGPATLRLRAARGHLSAHAWGSGAEVALAQVPQLVGLDDPGLSEITPQHPFVAALVKRHRGVRVGRTGQVFPRLVSAGLAQKVTGANSKPALRRIAWRWGEAAPGPNEALRLLPEPAALARRDYAEFHPLNIGRGRADLVRRIASRAPALQRAADLPWGEARAHLERLRGIGPWTSGVVVGGPLGDPDAVPIGDYHLPNFVAWNLAGEPRADDARMMELLAPYAGRRGQIARLVKLTGKSPPRYGAKRRAIDIRAL